MEMKVQAKFVRMSPQKIRQVLELVKGKSVAEAVSILRFTNKRAATPVEKAIRSASANYLQRDDAGDVSEHDLVVTRAFADQGPTLRRFRPMSMGRVGRIRRKTSHITIVIDEKS
ncbi:MAG TPA: 50S ribosomal protein L22 [Calditrichia bacterium]|nr:50S ribosomal protein L22 [Calditrichota bacterium]HQV31235.1 50S ribosomal protein L22 [Calditrichia bacterium]